MKRTPVSKQEEKCNRKGNEKYVEKVDFDSLLKCLPFFERSLCIHLSEPVISLHLLSKASLCTYKHRPKTLHSTILISSIHSRHQFEISAHCMSASEAFSSLHVCTVISLVFQSFASKQFCIYKRKASSALLLHTSQSTAILDRFPFKDI